MAFVRRPVRHPHSVLNFFLSPQALGGAFPSQSVAVTILLDAAFGHTLTDGSHHIMLNRQQLQAYHSGPSSQRAYSFPQHQQKLLFGVVVPNCTHEVWTHEADNFTCIASTTLSLTVNALHHTTPRGASSRLCLTTHLGRQTRAETPANVPILHELLDHCSLRKHNCAEERWNVMFPSRRTCNRARAHCTVCTVCHVAPCQLQQYCGIPIFLP
jgi:hypothetical protein